MPYLLKMSAGAVQGVGQFKNSKGHTECVVFVQKAAGAPVTSAWRPGIKVHDAQPGDIAPNTAIATFDQNGLYPTDAKGRHAAIFLSKSPAGIRVLDQWNKQGQVKPRTIPFNVAKGTTRSNDGDSFYVIK
ncbi:MAG TPA: BPSL0067 family protein [Tepidisphaeraceae bacterium]|nr:BPSL0067 family protein [Tepidisphaeraceae bacterium]